MTKACCPGSFDPVTNGHLDVIERAARLFDELIVAVSEEPTQTKEALFTTEERIELLGEVTTHIEGLKVTSFDGLLVDFCREMACDVIVKGIRAVSDFDYEMQMAQMNARMGVPTVFLPTSPEFSYLSSSLLKQVVTLGGPITNLLPATVEKRLLEKLKK